MVAVLTPDTHDDVIHMADVWPYTAADYLRAAQRHDAFAEWCEEQYRKGNVTPRDAAENARAEARRLRAEAQRRYGAAHGRVYQTGK